MASHRKEPSNDALEVTRRQTSMKRTMKPLRHALITAAMAWTLAMLALGTGDAPAQPASTAPKQSPVTAIDILLEPDATMLQHAKATNDRLLKVYPKGFALDASHRPHITLVQRYVRTVDLDKVYAAAGKVFASANVTGLKLG